MISCRSCWLSDGWSCSRVPKKKEAASTQLEKQVCSLETSQSLFHPLGLPESYQMVASASAICPSFRFDFLTSASGPKSDELVGTTHVRTGSRCPAPSVKVEWFYQKDLENT